MSKEAVFELMRQSAADAVLSEKLERSVNTGDVSGFLEVASEHGHEFTVEDFAAALADVAQMQRGELNDAALENVAGGINPIPLPRLAMVSWLRPARELLLSPAHLRMEMPDPMP